MNNERKAPDVPFIVYESEQARAERNIKRMQILCGVIAASFVLLNVRACLESLQKSKKGVK